MREDERGTGDLVWQNVSIKKWLFEIVCTITENLIGQNRAVVIITLNREML